MTDSVTAEPRAGRLIRKWRQRRRMSQLDLALEAGVSARHLSFVETGRSRPSQQMVVHLAAQLDVPLRDRNELLLAAGYAPVYRQLGLDEPEMGPVNEILQLILKAQEPYPALVVNRHWGLVAANSTVALLTDGAAPELLEPPVNVLRLSLHPDGVASRILNLPEWRAHVLERLNRQALATGDPALRALHEELHAYPGGIEHGAYGDIAVPLRIATDGAEFAFISTVTSFGTATEVTLSELSIESFFPADAATARAFAQLG